MLTKNKDFKGLSEMQPFLDNSIIQDQINTNTMISSESESDTDINFNYESITNNFQLCELEKKFMVRLFLN